MSTNAEASYDGAIDDFLGESAGEEAVEEAPEPNKEQPAKKEQAKSRGKTPPKPAEAEEKPEDPEEQEEVSKPKDGPWRAELAKRGIDTPQVNQYMSEVVQPYMTRLEQQGGPISAMFEGDAQAAEVAAGLLNSLDENPAKTIADLITLLDVSDEDINALLGDESGETNTPDPGNAAEETPEETPEQRWVRERMETEERESQSEAYDNFLTTLGEEFGPGFDPDLFSLAMAASGDMEGAMQMYPLLQEKYAAPAAKPAPPVMGRKAPGQAPQPVEKKYDGSNDGWEAAMDDLFAEEKARRGR